MSNGHLRRVTNQQKGLILNVRHLGSVCNTWLSLDLPRIHLMSMPRKLGGAANKLATVVSSVNSGREKEQPDVKWVWQHPQNAHWASCNHFL